MRRCAHFLTFRLFVGVSVLTSRVGCGCDAVAAPKGVATAAMGRGALRVSWRCASTSGSGRRGGSSGGKRIGGSGEKSAQLWTMQSPVRDVLLCKADATGDEELWKFVEDKCKLSLTKVEKEEFKEHPEHFINDKELCNRIVSLPSYKLLKAKCKNAMELQKTARHLESLGIIDLQQWKEYAQKDTLLISAHAKGLLDGALAAVSQVLPRDQLEKHYYDTVSSAQWHYIEMDPNSGGLGMRVKEGLPAELWSDAEVNNYQEYEGQEVEGQPYIEAPQVPLMVLSSKEGWPYTYFNQNANNDCFVRREMVRVWRIIQQDITKWVEGGCTPISATPRILIGTPGIGKSFGGSYLLYELLRCDVRAVSVVAYFVHGDVYVFDRTSNPPNVHYFDEEAGAVRFVINLQKRYNGYIMYDVSDKKRNPPMGLGKKWCSLVISSPNEKNFSEWKKQRVAVRTIINCPTTVELKAMCAWMRRGQSNTLPNYWADVEKRMSNVGPLPRFVFTSDNNYTARCEAVDGALRGIDSKTVMRYYGMGNEGLWQGDKVSHKIVKITRLVRKMGVEIFCNELICPEVKNRILKALSNSINTDAALMAVLLPLHELIPRVLETVGVNAFKEISFVDRIRHELTEFRPKDSKRPGKPWVLYENIWAFPNVVISVPPKTAVKKTNLQFMRLYIPSSETFPVVDAFFFVKKPQKTMVGIQVTKSKYHDTTTSKVKALREYLAALFVESDSFPTDFTWEIVYVQHKDNIPMTHWQECKMNFPPGQGPAHNSIREEHEAIAKHWNKKVRQYHLKISSAGIHGDT